MVVLDGRSVSYHSLKGFVEWIRRNTPMTVEFVAELARVQDKLAKIGILANPATDEYDISSSHGRNHHAR